MDQVMQAMEEEGKTPTKTPKFWKAVSERMDGTRTHNQCRNKWKAKEGGRIQWRDSNSKTLFNKYVCRDTLGFTLTDPPESRI